MSYPFVSFDHDARLGRTLILAASFIAILVASPAPVHSQERGPQGAANTVEATRASQATPPAATAAELAKMPITGEYGSEVVRRWRAFLNAQDWREGENSGNVFLTSGTAIVSIDKGRAGWIEARRIAFEIAHLKAKAEMIRLLTGTVERTANVRLFENPSFDQGYIETQGALDQASRIFHKTADASEMALDKLLEKLDPEYDSDKYKGGGLQAKEKRLEDLYRERLVAMASLSLGGALTYHVIEGPSGNTLAHEILVGLIWSPNLSRLATAIDDREYGMPLEEAGVLVKDQLPHTVGEATASFGTRVIINEKGQRAVLAFGQAEPAQVDPLQADRALGAAMDRAERYAEAAIASFVGERVTFRQTSESRALTAVYAGLGQNGATINVKSIQEIGAATRKVKLTGVVTVWRQVVSHPETGQKIAIVAKMWSPESLAAAKEMKGAIEGARAAPQPTPGAGAGNELKREQVPIVIERQPNDKRVY